MKKITFYRLRIAMIIAMITFFYGSTMAQDHILLRFTTGNNPIISPPDSNGNYQITTNDPSLNAVFSNYSINVADWQAEGLTHINNPGYDELSRTYLFKAVNGVDNIYSDIINAASWCVDLINNFNEIMPLLIPNDYSLKCTSVPSGSCSHWDLVNAPAAWDISTGDPSIVIGVCDFEFHPGHEDLFGQVLSNTAPIAAPGAQSHGTFVAGLIAAIGNNNKGVVGIAHNCKMRFFPATYLAIEQAADAGCKVINCSWGSCAPLGFDFANNMLTPFITYAKSRGATIVAAAGNGNGAPCSNPELNSLPASLAGVISVSAVGDRFTEGSPLGLNWKDYHDQDVNSARNASTRQHNENVDLCAPGFYDIISTSWHIPNVASGYSSDDGTSLSSPIVAGAAALILSVNPSIPPDDVEKILKCSARDLMEIKQNRDRYLNLLGAGRLDANQALVLAQGWPSSISGSNSITPTDVRWEVRSGVQGFQSVETTVKNGQILIRNFYCNAINNDQIRLTAVNAQGLPINQAHKWIIEHQIGSTITQQIKYGNPIILTKGVDYDNPSLSASFSIFVKGNNCTPSNYRKESTNNHPNCVENPSSSLHRQVLVENIFEKQLTNFQISPNPASNFVTITKVFSSNSVNDIAFKIELYDMSNRKLLEKIFSANSGKINTQSLTNGTYVVRIIHDKKVYSHKLIILK